MTQKLPTQQPGDKLKKAITLFAELLKKHPDKSRQDHLHRVEIQFDLSPRECEFLNTYFDGEEK